MTLPPSKLPNVGTTIFTTMSALAATHQAINLGQGFPDFPMNAELIELVAKAMSDGYNQYTPMQGYLPLREAIAEKVFAAYNCQVDPQSSITITPGGTYAIYTALTSMLQAGDEVIVFEPAYDSYIPNIEINGAVAVRIQLQYPAYSINWNEVREKITPRTKMIMINSPHNPSGTVLSAADMEELSSIVRDTNILILSDEVYEHLIFDDKQHESVLKYPALRERAFVCFSFGKVFHCTGWKMGYSIAPEAMMKEFRKVHQFNCFSCHSPVQVALAEFLKNKEHYLQLGGYMQKKRDFLRDALSGSKLEPLESHGSYFQLYSYKNISDEKDTDFAIRLIKEVGVATIPVSVFYTDQTDNKVIRLCFAKEKDTLQKAAERLRVLST